MAKKPDSRKKIIKALENKNKVLQFNIDALNLRIKEIQKTTKGNAQTEKLFAKVMKLEKESAKIATTIKSLKTKKKIITRKESPTIKDIEKSINTLKSIKVRSDYNKLKNKIEVKINNLNKSFDEIAVKMEKDLNTLYSRKANKPGVAPDQLDSIAEECAKEIEQKYAEDMYNQEKLISLEMSFKNIKPPVTSKEELYRRVRATHSLANRSSKPVAPTKRKDMLSRIRSKIKSDSKKFLKGLKNVANKAGRSLVKPNKKQPKSK